MCAEFPFLQNEINLAIESPDMLEESGSGHCAASNSMPLVKKIMRQIQQFVAKFRCRFVSAFGHSLEVAFQVCPAPLMLEEEVIHLRSITRDDTLVRISQQRLDHARGFRHPHRKTVKVAATTVQIQAFSLLSRVGVSSTLTADWLGSFESSSR